MKSVAMLAALFVLLAGFPQSVISQEPPLDLAITDLTYVCVGTDSAYVEAQVQLATFDAIELIETEVRFDFDGVSIGSVLYDVLPAPQDPCVALGPPCDGTGRVCWPDTINGDVVQGSCVSWVIPGCACIYLVYKGPVVGSPQASSTCSATIDPDNTIAESDETNNSMTIGVGPSALQGTVWGTLKSLYR